MTTKRKYTRRLLSARGADAVEQAERFFWHAEVGGGGDAAVLLMWFRLIEAFAPHRAGDL